MTPTERKRAITSLRRALSVHAESTQLLAQAMGLCLELFEPEEKSQHKPDVLEKLTGTRKESKPSLLPTPEGDDAELDVTARKILGALIQLGGSADWITLSIVSGLTSSGGTTGMSLARMRRATYLEGGSSGYHITAAGRAAYGPEPVPLPRGHNLFEWWCQKLGSTESRILKAIRNGETTVKGMGFTSSGGTTGMALSRLKKLKFIQGGAKGGFAFTQAFKRMTDPTIKVFDGQREMYFDAKGVAR